MLRRPRALPPTLTPVPSAATGSRPRHAQRQTRRGGSWLPWRLAARSIHTDGDEDIPALHDDGVMERVLLYGAPYLTFSTGVV